MSDAPEPSHVPASNLITWYPVSGGTLIHAFAQDPETHVFKQIPLCRAGLVANSTRSGFGKNCPACERIFKFIQYTANKYVAIGRREGAAAVSLARFSTTPPAASISSHGKEETGNPS